MRHLCGMILVLLLLFGMWGCGTANKETVPEQTVVSITAKDKLAAAEGSNVLILLSVNPSFELYVGDNSFLRYVKAANEDAAKVLAGDDFAGVWINDCIPMLLERMQAGGYIKEGSQLALTTYMYDDDSDSYDYQKAIDEAVDIFMNTSGITVTYSNALQKISRSEEDNAEKETVGSGTGTTESPDTTKRYTEDGKLIETHISPEGFRTEYYYSFENTVEKTVAYFADGSREIALFDEKGNVTESEHYDPSGKLDRCLRVIYHADGFTEYEHDPVTDDILVETEYNAAGVMVKQKIYELVGFIEVFYDATGRTEYEVKENPDGSRWEKHYSQTNIVEYEYSAQGAKISMTEYDTNHVKQRICTYNLETGDLQTEEKYEGDMLLSRLTIESSRDLLDIYENGIRIRQDILWREDYGIEWESVSCDAQGNLVGGKRMYSDGSYWLTSYGMDEWGEYVNYMECYNAQGVLTAKWYTDSRLDPEGTWTRFD